MNDVTKYIFYNEFILTILCKARYLSNRLNYISSIGIDGWDIWFTNLKSSSPTIVVGFDNSEYFIYWYSSGANDYRAKHTSDSFRDIEKYLELWIKLYPNLPS